jgi:aryl carrier-like protein
MSAAQSGAEIKQWLVVYIARLLEFEPEEVKTGIPLGRYGLDSIAAAALTDELGKYLGRTVDPHILYEHRTIDALAAFLAER